MFTDTTKAPKLASEQEPLASNSGLWMTWATSPDPEVRQAVLDTADAPAEAICEALRSDNFAALVGRSRFENLGPVTSALTSLTSPSDWPLRPKVPGHIIAALTTLTSPSDWSDVRDPVGLWRRLEDWFDDSSGAPEVEGGVEALAAFETAMVSMLSGNSAKVVKNRASLITNGRLLPEGLGRLWKMKSAGVVAAFASTDAYADLGYPIEKGLKRWLDRREGRASICIEDTRAFGKVVAFAKESADAGESIEWTQWVARSSFRAMEVADAVESAISLIEALCPDVGPEQAQSLDLHDFLEALASHPEWADSSAEPMRNRLAQFIEENYGAYGLVTLARATQFPLKDLPATLWRAVDLMLLDDEALASCLDLWPHLMTAHVSTQLRKSFWVDTAKPIVDLSMGRVGEKILTPKFVDAVFSTDQKRDPEWRSLVALAAILSEDPRSSCAQLLARFQDFDLGSNGMISFADRIDEFGSTLLGTDLVYELRDVFLEPLKSQSLNRQNGAL